MSDAERTKMILS